MERVFQTKSQDKQSPSPSRFLLILIDCCRRDKIFCHECRFCCTLSICTTSNGTYYKDSDSLNENAAANTQKLSAKAGYEVDMKLYKAPDFRCLKPLPMKPPQKWPHYDMPQFRQAKTAKELKQVKTHPFDINFFNLEDPKEEWVTGWIPEFSIFDSLTQKYCVGSIATIL